MPRPKTRNGALKNRLLEESLTLLESEGPSALTARRVATVTKTSTAAVYELFGSKSGLVRSLFYEGFEQLANNLEHLEESGDAEADLVASLAASRAFAIEFPMLFEVMYARPFLEFEPTAIDMESATRIYSHVINRVASVVEDSKTSTRTVDAAHALIAINRGLIAAELSGLLGQSLESISRRRTLAISATLAGLTNRKA